MVAEINGEIGYFKLDTFRISDDDYGNLKYSNYFDSLSLYSVLEVVRREVCGGIDGYWNEIVSERKINGYDITIKDMIDAYNAGEPFTVKVINSSAAVIGSVAANIAEYLDIDIIIINGAAVDLGKGYLEAIRRAAVGKKVEFSSLLSDTTIMGAINAGITQAFFQQL